MFFESLGKGRGQNFSKNRDKHKIINLKKTTRKSSSVERGGGGNDKDHEISLWEKDKPLKWHKIPFISEKYVVHTTIRSFLVH